MSAPATPPSPARHARKMKSYDDDDIVRYSMTLDIPVVGLVRNRDEYKEMREIALIYGTTLGIGAKAEKKPDTEEPPRDEREVA